MTLPVKEVLRLVANNKNSHVMNRSICRGHDGQWKHFVDAHWLLTLPEFDKGFPETIKFEHRIDANALYFGPSNSSLKLGLEWLKPESIQFSIDAMIGSNSWSFDSKRFATPSPERFELQEGGLLLGNLFWPFDSKGFMPLILKHEPFDPATLQAFHGPDAGGFGYRTTRIVSPHREFYVMMEEL